jgi:tRNA (guanine37-N1)-methyltransferase
MVLDMFAGVGPFSIVIARKHPSATVYAVEKNPEAYRYLCINVALNKLVGRVTPIHGDAAKVVPSLQTKFNRVVMNLPHLSLPLPPHSRSSSGNQWENTSIHSRGKR